MAVQDSTFRTSHVMDNEIIKANDFEFAFEQLVENVSKATQMLLESDQDFVINGKVLFDSGMSVRISPIYGVCKETGKPFGRTETTDETLTFTGSESGRIDIIEVQGAWLTYDEQQRAFNDPDTDTQTYQYVNTKKLMKPVYQIKQGVEGAGVAPDKSDNWVKLAEVVIPAGVTVLSQSAIKNITADVAGEANADWTNEEDVTYNIGYISDVNERFRVQHNEDGTHKKDVINQDSLDIGIGTKQINGNVLPVGGAVSIPNETIGASDPILSVITKAAAMITSLYNSYLQYDGAYNFKGDVSISALADPDTKVLTKPITFHANGDGTAVIKVANNTMLTINADGRLTTNGQAASGNNDIVTKAVTDAISTSLGNLTTRVSNLEQNVQQQSPNKVLSTGKAATDYLASDGQFNVSSVQIMAATVEDIVLNGTSTPTVDGVVLSNDDLILVKNQTDETENGIYKFVSNSGWDRADDFNTPAKLKGQIVKITDGTVNKGKMFYMINEVVPDSYGTDNVYIAEYFGSVSPLANHVIIRDANGRAQVAAPATSCDIARKKEIDDLYGNVTPSGLGTASVGTCTTFARSDHVHPMPSSFIFRDDICFQGECATYKAIQFKDGCTADGLGVLVGAGGLTVIGGGESYNTFYTNAGCTAGNEYMFITSDQTVSIITNLQAGWACRKTFTFNNSGVLTATTFCGNSNGIHVGNVYAAAPSANTSCCVIIRARCCNGSAITNKDFKFCADSYMYGNVCGNLCGNADTAVRMTLSSGYGNVTACYITSNNTIRLYAKGCAGSASSYPSRCLVVDCACKTNAIGAVISNAGYICKACGYCPVYICNCCSFAIITVMDFSLSGTGSDNVFGVGGGYYIPAQTCKCIGCVSGNSAICCSLCGVRIG